MTIFKKGDSVCLLTGLTQEDVQGDKMAFEAYWSLKGNGASNFQVSKTKDLSEAEQAKFGCKQIVSFLMEGTWVLDAPDWLLVHAE